MLTNQVTEIQHLALSSGDTLHVTAAHPFYSLTYGTWRYAGELEEGEQLLTQSGNVSVCDNTIASGTYKVYNVEVRQWHNYLVGKDAVVVHNSCVEDVNGEKECTKVLKELADKIGGKLGKALEEERKKIIEEIFEKLGKGSKTIMTRIICAPSNYSNAGNSIIPIPVSSSVKSILSKVGKTIQNTTVDVMGDQLGFADMSPFALYDVDIDMNGNHAAGTDGDYTKAVNALMEHPDYNVTDKAALEQKMSAKYGKTVKISNSNSIEIDGQPMTWHHHQNCKTMQLVPSEIHSKSNHVGGVTLIDKYGKEDARKLMPLSPSEITKQFLCKK